MAQLEVKKMKQGMSYSCKEKTIILNVFKYFRTQFPEKCVTEIVRRTAKATGCSEKSIFQFRKEEASVEGFREPSKTKVRKNININSRDIKYDHHVRQAIRNIIYNLKYRNIIPSLNTILKHVNGDTLLPNFSLMTLRRLMFDMGFYYEKNGNKSVLAEKSVDNKDNVPKVETKPKKSNVNKKSSNTSAVNQPVPSLPQNVNNITPQQLPAPVMPHNMNMHHQHMHVQRLMPMHMPPSEGHMMPHMHAHAPVQHNMPMMLSPRRELMPPPHAMGPPNMDMHMKRDVPPWMQTHNMLKQQL